MNLGVKTEALWSEIEVGLNSSLPTISCVTLGKSPSTLLYVLGLRLLTTHLKGFWVFLILYFCPLPFIPITHLPLPFSF